MMKFIIDDENKDPRDGLQLMLKLTSKLLPGTEVYKLYDCILSTCADPKRAYMHLSIVAALANPLPISQISSLLGPRFGRDVQTTLMQLRSIVDIPTDNTLPVNIYHSSIRDYVSDPSNCSLPQVREHDMPSPHCLLADSSFFFRLMIQSIPETTALSGAFSELEKQSQAMRPEDPHRLKFSLSFLVPPLDALSVLICMLWLRGDRASDLQFWLDTLDGCAWVQTINGQDWLQTVEGRDWLQIQAEKNWLQTDEGRDWWLRSEGGRDWLQDERGREWLQTWRGRDWLRTDGARDWLLTWERDWLLTEGAREWLQTWGAREWLQSKGGQEWLQVEGGRDWLLTEGAREWLQTWGAREWLQTEGGQEWLQTEGGREWWLQTEEGYDWLQTEGGREWIQTQKGLDWLQAQRGEDWLRTPAGGQDWLQNSGGKDWLQTAYGQAWQSTPAGSVWATMEEFSSMLEGISKYIIVPELALLPTFKVVQQLKCLPDFLMFPVFLALVPQNRITSASPEVPDREIIRAMKLFIAFANEAQERSQSSSDALKYASRNWVVHLSRAPNPWDDTLNHIFRVFWTCHLLSWLERQWCLKGLRSCLDILSEGQKLVKVLPLLQV